MMEVKEFLQYMNSGKNITTNSDVNECMHRLLQGTMQLTGELNECYHTPEKIREKLPLEMVRS